MARAPALVGDDSRCDFHNRLPVRIGNLGNEHLSLLELPDIFHILDDSDRTGGNLRTDSCAGEEHFSFLLQYIFLEDIFVRS